jgi:hypothetical protein
MSYGITGGLDILQHHEEFRRGGTSCINTARPSQRGSRIMRDSLRDMQTYCWKPGVNFWRPIDILRKSSSGSRGLGWVWDELPNKTVSGSTHRQRRPPVLRSLQFTSYAGNGRQSPVKLRDSHRPVQAPPLPHVSFVRTACGCRDETIIRERVNNTPTFRRMFEVRAGWIAATRDVTKQVQRRPSYARNLRRIPTFCTGTLPAWRPGDQHYLREFKVVSRPL